MRAFESGRGTWRRLRAGSLLVWLLLPLLGCGSTIQAEDATTVAVVQRARALYDQGEYQAAKDKASLAVNRSPDNPQARYVRALANLKLEDYALAREDLERAQQIDPLAMFAATKQEFDTALQTAIENTAQALNTDLTTPPLPKPADAASSPSPAETDPAKPKPAPTEPGAKAIAAAGTVMEDLSGKGILGEPQKRSMIKVVRTLEQRGLTVKFLVIAPGPDPETEAQRLASQAGLGSHDLLILAQPPDKVVGYTATLTPDAIRGEIAEALASAGDASLARKMILAANAVGSRLQLPPDVEGPKPPTPKPADSTTGPLLPDHATPSPSPEATSPVPVPPSPQPVPARPSPQLIGLAVGVIFLAGLVWTTAAKILARRRLGQGFAAASPHLVAVAEGLARVGRRLLTRSDRQAAASHAAAELAYFEAVAMMSAADDEDTGDIARVERAERLLEEADAKLAEADERMPDEVTAAESAPNYCWFTARPLTGRWDGDLVKLTCGDQERLVLASREVGTAIRRGETPTVRAVELDGQPVHWAVAPGFEPLEDYYRTDRFGWVKVLPGALREVLVESPGYPIYVEFDERPDFNVSL